MSIEAMVRAWHADVESPLERLVLLEIANRSTIDPDGETRLRAPAGFLGAADLWASVAAWGAVSADDVASAVEDLTARGVLAPALDVELSRRDYLGVLRRDPCAYCGGTGEHLDHVHPRALAGGDELENLTSACQPCNSSKSATPLLPWMAGR